MGKPNQVPQGRIPDLLRDTHIAGDATGTFPLPLDLYRARKYQTIRKRHGAEDREDFLLEMVKPQDVATVDD